MNRADDYKYSELLVNCREVDEMQGKLNDTDGAYRWNVQAPAILSNFENFKKFEKDVLFNAFITYLNTVNTKTSSLVDKNEAAMNFILKEYQIDQKRSKYRDHVIRMKCPPRQNKGTSDLSVPPSHKNAAARKSSTASKTSSSSCTAPAPVKEKTNSKLKSKVGSIFGRKKKSASLKQSETIPETGSISSLPSRQGTFVSRSNRNSLHNAPLGSASSKQKNRSNSALSLSQSANNSPEKAMPETPDKRTSPASNGKEHVEESSGGFGVEASAASAGSNESQTRWYYHLYICGRNGQTSQWYPWRPCSGTREDPDVLDGLSVTSCNLYPDHTLDDSVYHRVPNGSDFDQS